MSELRCANCPHPEAKCVGPEWKRRGKPPVLMIVGMNPGKMEVNLSRPFVGPSGGLLRQALRDWAGAIYVTNAVKCGPRNETGKGMKKITTVEVEHCLMSLVQEVQELQPQVVLFLGELAESAMVRLRDQGFLQGMTVVQHPHPAASLHPGGMRQGTWIQSCQAALVKAMTPVQPIMMESLTLDTVLPLLIGSDTEYPTDPIWKGPMIWCLSDGDRAWAAVHPTSSLRGVVLGRTMVFHHAVNELIALKALGVAVPESLHDTMVLAALEDEEGPRDLKTLAATKIGYVYDVPRRRQMSDDERTTIYCGHDARAAMRLFRDYFASFAGRSALYRDLYQPIIPMLATMGFRGIRVDREAAITRFGVVEAQIARTESELKSYKDIRWSSDDQVAQYFIEKAYALEKMTPSGRRPSVDKEALTLLSRKGVREAELVILRRGLTNEKNTYLDPLIKCEGVIRTVFNPVGAETGRISSSGTNQEGMTNLQNIPLHLRHIFLPPEGLVWISADASQHEVRTLAWLAERNSPRRPLSTALQSQDFYEVMAHLFMGRMPTVKERDAFKTVILAGQYLARPGTLQKHLEQDEIYMDRETIERMMRFIDERFPTIRMWHEQLFEEAKSTGQITTPLGRRRKVYVGVGGMLTPETRKIIVNSPVQGTASDFTLFGLKRAWEKNLQMLLTVHDSMDAAARPEDAREVAWEMKRAIEDEPLLGEAMHGILKVKVKSGSSWGNLEVVDF